LGVLADVVVPATARSEGELMLRGRKLATVAAAGVAAMALVAACGGSSGGSTGTGKGGSAPKGDIWSSGLSGDVNTVNTANVGQGGKVVYVSEKDFNAGWNLNTSASNTFELGELEDLIYPSVYLYEPDLTGLKLTSDTFASAELTSTNPQVVTYKIQPNAKWSDGAPIDVNDFIYFWKAQNGTDCKTCDILGTTGYDDITSITGSDNNKTVTVKFKAPYSDWKGLFGGGYGILPSHLAKSHGWDNTPTGLAKSWNTYFVNTVPKVSGGPFVIQTYKANKYVILAPNPNYYGTKPKLSQLVFQIITDATQEPTALQNGEVDAIYPQPELDLLNAVKRIPNTAYQLDSGLSFEHFDFNLHTPSLAQGKGDALRKALFTAVDTKQLIARTVGQFDSQVQQDGNLIFVPLQTKYYQDSTAGTGFGSGDLTAAKKLLTDAGYTGVGTALKDPQGKAIPTLRMRYTVGNAIRQTECQLFATQAKALGVNVKVESTDSLGKTLGHDPAHDFDVVVFAYVGGPLFVSGNAPIYQSGAGGNIMFYTNSSVDSLLKQAIASTDLTKAADFMNQASKQVVADAASLPLYEKPLFLAYHTKIGNIRDNATQMGPPYNAQQWGLKTTST
jgi:peptide/nickel transport system substrate-binding protein